MVEIFGIAKYITLIVKKENSTIPELENSTRRKLEKNSKKYITLGSFLKLYGLFKFFG